MNVIISVLVLLAFAFGSVVACVISPYLALPGTLMATYGCGHYTAAQANRMSAAAKARVWVGVLLGAVLAGYGYAAYVGLIVGWTAERIHGEVWVAFILWPVAVLCAYVPLFFMVGSSQASMREHRDFAHSIVGTAATLGIMLGFIAFPIFAFFPALLRAGWPWLPFGS